MCDTFSCHKHKANGTEFCISNYKIIKSSLLLSGNRHRLSHTHTHTCTHPTCSKHARRRDIRHNFPLFFFFSFFLCFWPHLCHLHSPLNLSYSTLPCVATIDYEIVNHAFRSRIFSRVVHKYGRIDQNEWVRGTCTCRVCNVLRKTD